VGLEGKGGEASASTTSLFFRNVKESRTRALSHASLAVSRPAQIPSRSAPTSRALRPAVHVKSARWHIVKPSIQALPAEGSQHV
jgi:hypothetical protein